METTPEVLLELRHVDVPRVDVAVPSSVIEDVCWTVHRSDFWAIGAHPGSGKTDLLSTAGGLQRPLRGTQILFGKDTFEMREDEFLGIRLKVGMVFDAGRLFSHLTVAENITLPLAYHFNWTAEQRAERAARALEVTGLERFADRLPAQITRNLHQRVGLARALALEPELLLIDNPLSMVDARQSRWWIDFLCKLSIGHEGLSGRAMTIVVVTSDLLPWTDTARQFAILQNKTFQVIGGRNEITSTDQPIVRELLMRAFEE
jgi:ABC-type transporter Mla maintaining outer membrane lipid asymmetry ATPase subunit MlaF